MIEKQSGLSYSQIVDTAGNKHAQLLQSQKELVAISKARTAAESQLDKLNEQKGAATADLKNHMKQIGVDEDRLKRVEALAKALRAAKIPDTEIEGYVDRQKLLNTAELGIELLAEVIEETKIATVVDNGKHLLHRLTEYCDLDHVVEAMKAEEKTLTGLVSDLKYKAELRKQIDAELKELQSKRSAMIVEAADLEEIKVLRKKLKKDISELTEARDELASQVSAMQFKRDGLFEELDTSVHRIAKLGNRITEMVAMHDALEGELKTISVTLNQNRNRLDLFSAFMTFIGETSLASVEKLGSFFPELISELRLGRWTPGQAKGILLNCLGVDKLHLMICNSCGTTFAIGGESPIGGFRCPNKCLSHAVVEDQGGPELLKAVLAVKTTPTVAGISPHITLRRSSASDG
jgi:hypothetical protein